MTQFRIFKQVPRLLFGEGSLARLTEILPSRRNENDYYIFVIDDCFKAGQLVGEKVAIEPQDVVEWFPASMGEPSTDQVDKLKARVISMHSGELPIAIIGIGGGATMDVAKALSVVLKNAGSASQYQGWDLVHIPGVYKVGVPTISGSGAEASRTAVLMGKDRKFGINSDHSMFDAIIIDSTLTTSVPLDQKFFSGMDCYIHCVESISGTMINELAKGYASKALELCELYFLADGTADMIATASYLGGVSIVNSEVGICHALSYGLSLELGYRHGFANCIAFNVLEEYYGNSVATFRKMLSKNGVSLPKGVCQNLDSDAVGRMIEMTLRMERPLTNALGENWRQIFTSDKIRALYKAM
jgi:3-deoxy-alpha-D-manno-octulosonate 8-oxidase